MVRCLHRGWIQCVALGLIVLAPIPVAAQTELEEAGRLFNEANFEDALEVLDAAEQGSGLDRAGVVRALVLRALVQHALGDPDELDRALRELATIEPSYSLDVSIPPAVRGRLEVILSRDVQPLGLTVETSAVSGGYQITVRVDGDRDGVIRGITIFSRIPDGEWLQNDGNMARIPLARGSELDYYVQGIGPGGALLLSEGSAEEPLHIGEGEAPVIIEPPIEPVEPTRISPWVWVGISAGVVVVTAVVLGAVLGTRQVDNTSVGPLEIDWP